MNNKNKRIAVNTMIIYIKMVIMIVVGLFTTRYVLLALGVSDFGLINVVGGILAMLNIVSTAMHATTRRYINVEMGKKEGNPNKVFNICLNMHVLFALLTLVLAESIGMFYIYNYLKVEPGKLNDAIFVFQCTTIVSMLGLINVPFQAVLNAFENFITIAILDLSQVILKLPLIYFLIKYEGNALRFYTIGMCLISLLMYIGYISVCYYRYHSTVKLKWYRDRAKYKEILIFNGYIATGAAVSIVKGNGTSMIANFFFGTIVNGALGLAYQIQRYMQMFAMNLGASSAPQITQSYSAGDYQRTQKLVESVTKYIVLIMAILVTTVACELEFILTVWLKVIPEGALILCQWIMLSLFLHSFDSCITTVLAAHGKLRETTVNATLTGILLPVVMFVLLYIGFPPPTIVIITMIFDLITKAFNLIITHYVTKLDVPHYLKSVYPVIFLIGGLCGLYYYVHQQIVLESIGAHLLSMLMSFFFSMVVCYMFGLNKEEKQIVLKKSLNFVQNKQKR